MDEKANGQDDGLEISKIKDEASRLLSEIKELRAKAEDEFKQAEFARKNADSEGLFAVNAKKTCEEHATNISQIKGTVESETNAIKSNKQTSDELLAALTANKAMIDSQIKEFSDRRKEAEDVSKAIQAAGETCSTRIQEIEKLKLGGDEILKGITANSSNVEKAKVDTENAREKTLAVSSNAEQLATAIENHFKACEKQNNEIGALLKSSQEEETELKVILEHIKKSDSISLGHETDVEKLKQELKLLIKRVDDLLPGATSTSLASSFSKQKVRFGSPQKWWIITFIGCIAGLILVALPSFLTAIGVPIIGHKMDPTSGDILHSLLLRMPIAVPLIWLAIYAGRNYMLSLRLEEEYAYKEAVSRAFEGYKRELSGIQPVEGEKQPPLYQFCTNVLAAIAKRPGQIYEGKHKDITIANEAQEIAKRTIARE